MTMFVNHPLIKPDTIESRIYQEVMVASASQRNTLVVAPTALGKTVVAVLLCAHRLEKVPGSKILMLSTTKPLANQHGMSFNQFLNIPKEEIIVFTGDNPPAKRKEQWENSRVICATPQVIHNDILTNSYSLKDISLVIFDEAHRSSGDYPYSFIADNYMKAASEPLILGLTASPGSDMERINQVLEDLFIKNIEIRTEEDPDVKGYIKGIGTMWEKVDLPTDFLEIKKSLDSCLNSRIKELQSLDILKGADINSSKKNLLGIRGRLQNQLQVSPDPQLYKGLSLIAGCINLTHALELLETQGLKTLQKYFQRMKNGQKSKAVKELLRDPNFLRAMRLTGESKFKYQHPKLEKLVEIVKDEDGKRSVIIFSHYRDSAQAIVDALKDIPGVNPIKFVGQASRENDSGLTQKKQLEVLERFRDGTYNVLVATSVAEEGLDIPKVDLVIFYEPIPSEIRSIQRRGRTGRSRAGKVIILMAKKTRDEGFYWSGVSKERRMKGVLMDIKERFRENPPSKQIRKPETQKGLDDFFQPKYSIIVDSRELSSKVARELLKRQVISRPQQLDVGDYVISSRVCVERKTTEDFLMSIMDRRLMDQLIRLKKGYSRPLMILEGEGLYTKKNISPEAIQGALASIAVDLGIPILTSRDEEETAGILTALAKREQEEKDMDIQIRGEKRILDKKEQLEYIMAGFPNVNIKIARRLLDEFKTIKAIINAEEEELTRVEGIGKKIAKKIKELVDSNYSNN